MPVKASSSKRSKRQAISDIEDDDNELPTRDTAGATHSSVTGKRQQGNSTRANGPNEDDEDDEDRIDVENFRDQPLGRADINKLQNIARDWNIMEGKVRPNWRVVGDVAVALVETGEGDQVEEGLAKLDIMMRNLIDISAEMQSHEQALEELSQKIARGEEVDDAVEQYIEIVRQRQEQYLKKTTRKKYAKSEEYTTFRSSIFEAQHPGDAIPPINEFIPKEDGDESNDEEDFEMGGASQNYNCPITLTLLKDPVTSRVCKHSYSRTAIMQSFKGTRPVKCPAAGCSKMISRDDLTPDTNLAKRVKAYERRARRAAEHDDAEEIVD